MALVKMNLMFSLSTNLGWMEAVAITKMARTAMIPNSRTLNTRSASRRELEATSPFAFSMLPSAAVMTSSSRPDR